MIVGIDLGTTNSLIAVWKEGRPQLIRNAHGDVLTPSVVGVSDSGDILVGKAARERLVTHPASTASAFKRHMGTGRQITLGGQSFRPEELSALVLKSLKEDVEHYFGEPVDEAVVSVPAFFNDIQRKATRIAGELAGLNVNRLINEPTAAAIAYGLHQSADENRFLVFDLGGGTFDVSILELFDGVMEVHASAGDNFLGGEDFVEILVKAFLHANNLDKSKLGGVELSGLRYQMENAKRALNTEAEISVKVRVNGSEVRWSTSQSEYEAMIQPLLERLRAPVERALRDSRLMVSDINEVILVGGSTRKSVVQRLVSRMFGRLPLRQVNPDEVVAMGAAVQGGLIAKDQALSEVVLTDVCPYSLGIETADAEGGTKVTGLFEPILERNTVIPASRAQTFYPLEDYQQLVNLRVYQGESRLVRDNILLGEVHVPLPTKMKSESGVDVRFSYDTSGLLEVDAHVLATDRHIRLEIEQNRGVLSKEEIAKRIEKLSRLKIHPRDDLENQAAINRAKHVYEELLGDARAYVGELIAQFSTVLESQDPQRIGRARKELLDRLEQFDL